MEDNRNQTRSQTAKTADSKSDGQFCHTENTSLANVGAPSVQNAKSQRSRILRLLIDAHGAWVSLPEILALGIAQYGARVLELRRLGFAEENKTERVNGKRRSWFRLALRDAEVREREIGP